MSALVISPLSTSATPKETSSASVLVDSNAVHSSASKNVALPTEIAELRGSISNHESADAASTPVPSEHGTDISSNPSPATTASSTSRKSSSSKRASRRARLGKQFSTTSTVLARTTITNPNFSQVNYCIAAILQAQIFDDLFNPDISIHVPLEFCLQTGLSPEEGGVTSDISETVLDFETQNDEELREKILSLEVPTIDTIYRYIVTIIDRARYSIECNILALIYVNRMTQRKNFALTMENWRGFWISAAILAQKVWDDCPQRTSSFALMIPNTTKEQMRVLEMSAFRLLDFGTRVKPSTYARYYFELRKLYGEIVGPEGFETWNVSPLSAVEGQRLEYRSSLPGMHYSSGASSAGSTTFVEECNQRTSSHRKTSNVSSQLSSVSTTPMSVAPSSELQAAHGASNPDLLLSTRSTSTAYSTTSSVYVAGSLLAGNKRRVRGSSKTTEDLQPLSSSARYIIS